jgi:hypothetical protein
VTRKAAHCAKAVFDRFPYADCYKNRQHPSTPGTIELAGNPTRLIVNMFGQIYPGKPKFSHGRDSAAMREQYFKKCLDVMNIWKDSFAFPYIIGCGAAGGSPAKYLAMLEEFAKDREVVLYRMDK